MASLNETKIISIVYHNVTQSINLLNDIVSIDEIRQIIQYLFGDLPNSYNLKVYNPEKGEIIDLDQDELDYGYNPFKLSSLISHTNNRTIFNDVRLYVHTNRGTKSEDGTQTSI